MSKKAHSNRRPRLTDAEATNAAVGPPSPGEKQELVAMEPAGAETALAPAKPAAEAMASASPERESNGDSGTRFASEELQKTEKPTPTAVKEPAGTDEASASANADADVRPASLQIVYRHPDALQEHPDSSVVPLMGSKQFAALFEEVKEHGVPPERPIQILPDGATVLYGLHDWRAARQAKLTVVPCVAIDQADPKGYMLRKTLLEAQYTLDQYAYTAWQYKNHLSQQLRSERSSKAVATLSGSLSAQCADKPKKKRDARKETAALQRVSERKLRQLDEIARYEKERKVPLKHSKLKDIKDGLIEITKVHARIIEQQEKKAEKEREEKIADRLATVPALPPSHQWLSGDPLAVIKDHLGGEAATAGIILVGPADPADMERLVNVMGASVNTGTAIVALATFASEVTLLKSFQSAGLNVRQPFIWDMDGAAQGEPGTRHMSVLWAFRGEATLDQNQYVPASDIIPAAPVTVGDVLEAPVEFYWMLMQAFTAPGEMVLLPFARTANGYVAARGGGRNCVAIAASEEVFRAGRLQIDDHFEGKERTDQRIEALAQTKASTCAMVESQPAATNPAADGPVPDQDAVVAPIAEAADAMRVLHGGGAA